MSISRIHQTFRPFLVSSLPGYEYQCQRLCHSSQHCSPRQQRPGQDLQAGVGNSFSDVDPAKISTIGNRGRMVCCWDLTL